MKIWEDPDSKIWNLHVWLPYFSIKSNTQDNLSTWKRGCLNPFSRKRLGGCNYFYLNGVSSRNSGVRVRAASSFCSLLLSSLLPQPVEDETKQLLEFVCKSLAGLDCRIVIDGQLHLWTVFISLYLYGQENSHLQLERRRWLRKWCCWCCCCLSGPAVGCCVAAVVVPGSSSCVTLKPSACVCPNWCCLSCYNQLPVSCVTVM